MRGRAAARYSWRMASPTSLSAFSAELVRLVDQASAFVVAVDGRQGRSASGIIFGSDLVVTADHVLERDDRIAIRIADRRLDAEIAGREPGADIAVLRVAGLGGSEPPRSDTVRPGQLVVSVSRTPTAATPAAGFGVIAAVGGPVRTGRGIVVREVFRTNAAIYPGASGGAIVDTDGRVIGMATSGLLRGMPVGLPVPQLWELATALATNKTVKRPYLGVSVQPARLSRPASSGAKGGLLIAALAPDDAADRAGLLVGDIVVAVEGAAVNHPDDLQDRLAAMEAGATIRLGLVRGGVEREIQVVTGSR
jgi:S1-C subfamily serine protease